jgi:hypothetical protein
MSESFLHFIWKLQRFDPTHLATTDGEPLAIFNPGTYNQDAGPDFPEARVKVGGMEWNGHVEIHIKSSDWVHHRHQIDPAYNNVILHVVWEDDQPAPRGDGSRIPTLELKDRVDKALVNRFQVFMNQPTDILCASHLEKIPRLAWINNLDRMMMERLEEKAKRVFSVLKKVNQDWDETAYRLLGRNFGFMVNAEPFMRLTELLPLKIIGKHANSPHQVMALLFGMAGFLNKPADDEQLKLLREFEFLRTKYSLGQPMHRAQWKYGKMRPPNFPTVRLAEFASVIIQQPNLFSWMLSAPNVKEMSAVLSRDLPEYWLNHYDFGKKLKSGINAFGGTSMANVLINTAAPLLAAYARQTDDQKLMDKAVKLLEELPPESNRYTTRWSALGRKPKSAFDSQAMIGLYKNYCNRKKCLNCVVGAHIFSL